MFNMHRLLTCCLLVVTVVASARDDPDHQVLRVTEDQGRDDHHDQLPRVQMRVIGGSAVTNAMLGGYVIAMRYQGGLVCGGTLIRDSIVLTAAHCFADRKVKKDWLLDGGITNLNEHGQRRHIKAFVVSPQYRPTDMHWDVAIVLLDKPITGKNIGKLQLCTTQLKTGMHLVVSGWGLTSPNSEQIESHLHTVTVPFIDRGKCREKYRSSVAHITETMICAAVLGSKDACTFDSGGPLAYKKEVCGIVSFGIGCANRRYPGVYTDVKFVKPYIEQTIKKLLSKR